MMSSPHNFPQSILFLVAAKDGVRGTSGKFADVFSVQLEMLGDERVFIREAATEDANIVRLHVHQCQY